MSDDSDGELRVAIDSYVGDVVFDDTRRESGGRDDEEATERVR